MCFCLSHSQGSRDGLVDTWVLPGVDERAVDHFRAFEELAQGVKHRPIDARSHVGG